MLGEYRSLELLEVALAAAEADQAEAILYRPSSALTRFAESTIHQNVAEDNVTLSVRAVLGKRIGCARGNQAAAEEAAAVARRARDLAEVAAEDPAFVSLPGPRPISAVCSFAEATARSTPEQRAAIARTIADIASAAGCRASGSISVESTEMAVANSLGVRAYAPISIASVVLVVADDGSSGYADWRGLDISRLDAHALAEAATRKCVEGRGAQPVPPGEYTVILESAAVGDLLNFLGYLGFGALSLQEGRSFLTGRIGEQVMGRNITIWDDAADPRGLPAPFDWEGIPAQKVMLIEDGVARGVVYDSYTASKEGTQSTGHALPAPNTYGPMPTHLFLATGDATLDDMIASTDRGILVTRFHYTNVIHEKQTIITGMTRDGTFLIESGKVVRPVKNLRFTQSVVEALSHVLMIGREAKLSEGPCVPALKIEGFSFTS
jgi:predicted Zn-dependent protease